MIKRITEPSEMKFILLLNDDIEEYIEYDRSSWIQWLVSNVKNPLFGIFGDEENKSYIVALCIKSSPLFNCVQIIYSYNQFDGLLEKVKEWTKELNLTKILCSFDNLNEGEKNGFIVKNYLMELEV